MVQSATCILLHLSLQPASCFTSVCNLPPASTQVLKMGSIRIQIKLKCHDIISIYSSGSKNF